VDPSVVYANDRRQPSNVGLFLQEEFRVSSKMLLNAGFRYDRYSTFGGTTNPRLGLIFEPTGKTTFKLLYGRAFRAPSVFELYYFSLDTKASPNNLDPETVRTCEAVAEHYFGSRIKFSASAFFYQISGLISQLTDPASGLLYYDNLNKIRAKGLEFEVSGKGFRGIDGRLSYSVQQAKSLTEDEDLSNSPRHMARLNLALPLLGKGSWATTELSYMSSRKTLGGRIAGGFFLADIAFLKRNLFPNLDLSIGVYNLFNKRYGDPGGEEHLQEIIQQDGRTFRIRLSYSIPFSASRNAP
jgi:iron complex outermembrane receptor protein